MNNTDKDLSRLDIIVDRIVCVLIGFIIGIGISLIWSNKTNNLIERNNIIDSLTTVNDSIKIKVEKLDSIKDAKIIEVSTLNNDSTLKLFYELVSE